MHALKEEKTFRLPGAPIINDSLDIQLHPFQLFVLMPVLGKRIIGGYKNMGSNRGGGGGGAGVGRNGASETTGTIHSSLVNTYMKSLWKPTSVSLNS